MERQQRIAIVSPVFPPYRGGIGSVAAQDAALLRERGFFVEVFAPQYKNALRLTDGVTRFRPFYAWGNGAVLFDLLRALRDFDAIHLHYPFFGSDILTAFAARLWRIPLVVTCHMRPKASGILGAIFRAYRFVLERFIFGTARGVLVSSRDYAQTHGIIHTQLISYPFGVDTVRFSPGDAVRVRDLFGLRHDIPVILFVGGLDAAHYFKGVDVLLRACAMLKTPWQLLLVGDGDRRAMFEEQARVLGIADCVRFAGSVSFEDLPEVYRAADIHVLPSIDQSEAFGVVTLEAMATGIPSIVSDLPGVRSVPIPEETGLLVVPGSVESLLGALHRLLADPERRHQMGTAARERAVLEFSQETMADRLERIYKTIFSAQQ